MISKYKSESISYYIAVVKISVVMIFLALIYYSIASNTKENYVKNMGLFFFSIIAILFILTLFLRRLLYRLKIVEKESYIEIKEKIVFSRKYRVNEIEDIRILKFVQVGLLPRIIINDSFQFGFFLTNATKLSIVNRLRQFNKGGTAIGVEN